MFELTKKRANGRQQRYTILKFHKIGIQHDKLLASKPKEEEERYSCWCFVLIDGTGFEAKIVHKGRGKFKILNDEYGGKYDNKILDALDVIRCRVEI